MAHLDVTPDLVRVRLGRWERVWCGSTATCRSPATPYVLRVRSPTPSRRWKGSAPLATACPVMAPWAPGGAKGGGLRGSLRREAGVVIDLTSDRPDVEFRRLVVSVEDPETVAAALNR